MSKLDDLMTIETAARRVKMHRQRLRDLCIATGIAIRWGGTDRHPRLKVRLSELERVVLNQRYAQPSAPRRQIRRPPSPGRMDALHEDVRC